MSRRVDGSLSSVKVLLRIDAFQSRIRGYASWLQKPRENSDGYKRHILKDLELQMVRAWCYQGKRTKAYVITAIEEDLKCPVLTTKDIKDTGWTG